MVGYAFAKPPYELSPSIASEEACASGSTISDRTVTHQARWDVAALRDFDADLTARCPDFRVAPES